MKGGQIIMLSPATRINIPSFSHCAPKYAPIPDKRERDLKICKKLQCLCQNSHIHQGEGRKLTPFSREWIVWRFVIGKLSTMNQTRPSNLCNRHK